jgi:transcriptional regulator of acetoin/glycerol metabolism
LVGKKFDEIFDTRIEDLLAPAPLARQALWPLRDSHLGRRYFASLQSAAAPLSHAPARHVPEPRRIEQPVLPQLQTPAISTRSPSAPRAHARPNRELTFEDLAGSDPQMRAVARKAARVAQSTLPVLIQGPTGSGKECIARALHLASARKSYAFVAVNCAALPETLIESELFGYGPGAFTGARKEGRKGKIVQSSGGTLFLDEIGDMPLHLQTRLLRVLEEQEVIPLGADTAIPLDLRVVCASNRDLQRMLVTGEFRDDLYYRLNGILLELPPLQARTDKEILIRRLLEEEGQRENKSDGAIDTEAFECLTGYTWPGNIRELRNVIRSAFAICDGNRIRVADLPAILLRDAPIPLSVEPAVTPPGTTLEGAERDTLLSAIRANRGNLCHTARQLGISRNSLYRKLKRHGIGVSRVDGLSVRLSGPPASPPKP